MGSSAHAKDAMIRRLETELREKTTFADGIIASAEEAGRDLNDAEMSTLTDCRNRIGAIRVQVEQLEDVARIATETQNRAREIDSAISVARGRGEAGPIEYRSAGAYAIDMYQAHLGSREAQERLEVFHRAAAHQKTSDNVGIIPDPIVGDVINFIDAQRPIVSALGPRPLPGATWYRPLVTQHTTVALQGTAGAAADEKSELVSQKMTITRLTANAKTYGGYVNVSRQNIDFSTPSTLDVIIGDLAAQYALETEGAVADALAANNASDVTYDMTPTSPATIQDSVAGAVWSAAATAYNATKGSSLFMVVAPDRLSVFGPLFAPYGPQNQQGTGFSAASFGQGPLGSISGIPVYMSAGLASGEAFVVARNAIEVYEQRIGTLQVTEPSVLGVQVAYAGYFTPLVIVNNGIVPLVAG